MDTIALIEATYYDALMKQQVTSLYEVQRGAWVQLMTSDNGNPYWHSKQMWLARFADVRPLRQAHIRVVSEGRYVGHWNTIQEFRDFLHQYMRATITEEVTT